MNDRRGRYQTLLIRLHADARHLEDGKGTSVTRHIAADLRAAGDAIAELVHLVDDLERAAE